MLRDLQGTIRLAIDVAASCNSYDLPIATVILDSSGKVIASSTNGVVSSGDSTAHSELLALRQLNLASKKDEAQSLTLAVTLEPCPMCAWAIRASGIGRLIFGAPNPQYGAAGSVYDLLRDTRYGRPVEVIGGVLQKECQGLLDAFFAAIRNNGGR